MSQTCANECLYIAAICIRSPNGWWVYFRPVNLVQDKVVREEGYVITQTIDWYLNVNVCAREVERDLTNICVVFKGLCEEQELAGDCGCVDRGEGVRYANYDNSG